MASEVEVRWNAQRLWTRVGYWMKTTTTPSSILANADSILKSDAMQGNLDRLYREIPAANRRDPMKGDDDDRAGSEIAQAADDVGDLVVDESCHAAAVAAVGDAGEMDAELVVPGVVAAVVLVAGDGTWGTVTCSLTAYVDIGRCPGVR